MKGFIEVTVKDYGGGDIRIQVAVDNISIIDNQGDLVLKTKSTFYTRYENVLETKESLSEIKQKIKEATL